MTEQTVGTNPRASPRSARTRKTGTIPGRRSGLRRYSLVLPDELFDELQETADRRGTTVVELLRKFVRLGLLAVKADETPGMALQIRDGDREREIILI